MLGICLRYSGEYENEMFFLCMMQVLYSLIYMWSITKTRSADILLPIHLISYLYLGLFFITPILLIASGDEKCHGVNVMGGCYSATLIFLIGYIAFVIGYRFSRRYRETAVIEYDSIQLPQKNLVVVAVLLWGIGCISAILYLASTGKSLSYILSFGQQGNVSEYTTSSLGVRFLISFSYMMAMTYVVIFDKAKSIALKVIIGLITLSLYYVCGYRFIIIIVFVGCVIISFRRRNKELSYSRALLILLCILVMISVIGYSRRAVRSGQSITGNPFNAENIIYSLKSNFDIYQPFYGLVEKYPSEYPHTLGGSMVKDTLAMWIPRAIWSGKPTGEEQTMTIALMNSVSEFAIKGAAMAWPNIAEFYMEFGIIGVCILMYLFGRIASVSVKWYHSNNYKDVLKYAILMPTFLQLVIRGYTPSNVTMLVFLFIPLLGFKIFKNFLERRKHKRF